MMLSSKLNYSPDVMKKVALSIAVMVVRFAPKDSRFYSASKIAQALESLQSGNRTLLSSGVNSIKMGLRLTTY